MLKPSRLIAPLVAAAVLVVPAPAGAQTARAAAYSPGEVVVRYERGTSRREETAVQRATGVGAPKAFAPRTRVLTIRDGQSVADTVSELRARPEVATAAPNARAHLAALHPARPGPRRQRRRLAGPAVELPRPRGRQRARRLAAPARLRASGRPRRHRRGARHRHRLLGPQALPQVDRLLARRLRAGLRLRGRGQVPARRERPRHARGQHDRREHAQRPRRHRARLRREDHARARPQRAR